jgi:hypothetical protein
MKTQILHLESFDDIHSIKDQISWGQGERIILVWPLRGQLLEHKLDLKLIQRHTQARGMKLALVTSNRNVRQLASDLNIPVFRSLRQAKQLPWEYTHMGETPPKIPLVRYKNLRQLGVKFRTKEKPAWLDHIITRVMAFSLGIIACLALLAFFLPSAKITLTPVSEAQTINLTITANPSINTYNLSGAVPAQQISVIVEGRNELNATGEIRTPDEAARGEVVFTNLTIQPITIPQRTIVRTLASPPIRFATTTAEVLPGQAGAARTVAVEALNPGEESNLPADSLIVVEGSLGLYVSVTNPSPTTRGSERVSAAPTPEDYDSLSAQLLASLWETAFAEAQSGLAPNDIILNTSPREVTILEETFSPSEPQPSAHLSLLQRVEFDFLVISWQIFQEMINTTLNATLPTGFTPLDDTLTITPRSIPEFKEDNTVIWEVTAQREIYTLDNITEIIQSVRGKRISKAVELISQNLSLDGSAPEIKITPSWWPWLPFHEMRIEVISQE